MTAIKTIRETPNYVLSKFELLIRLNYYGSQKYRFLEPSAGSGRIADMLKKFDDCTKDLTCVELNNDLCNILKDKGFNTIHSDFLNYNVDNTEKFDIIVAAPPFKGNIDLKHIMHMYEMLAENGFIISLTSPYWLTNNEPLQVEFRSFISDKIHQLELLPDNTFVEKGKTVPTAILFIEK